MPRSKTLSQNQATPPRSCSRRSSLRGLRCDRLDRCIPSSLISLFLWIAACEAPTEAPSALSPGAIDGLAPPSARGDEMAPSMSNLDRGRPVIDLSPQRRDRAVEGFTDRQGLIEGDGLLLDRAQSAAD